MITFDSLMLKTFIDEESQFFQGARINKIQQPTRREIILTLRNNGISRQFYINITPDLYHICFTSEDNYKKKLINIPQNPPMFCMLLRKYLLNSRISKINQPQEERILELYFETYNEINDKIYLCLAIELMGKHSNVILYNTDTNIILGCAHNVGEDKSRVRELFGTIPYTYPPIQNNTAFLDERYGFLNQIYNCSKQESLKQIYKNIGTNRTIDNYFSEIISNKKFKDLKNKYTNNITEQLKKVKKSLKEIEKQLNTSQNTDKYRLYGDLLMANLYNLDDYIDSAKVFDYENNSEILINLDKSKTIKENANKFYKKYNKTKIANNKLTEIQNSYEQKKQYLESIQYSINISDKIQDLYELEDELDMSPTNNKKDKKAIEPIALILNENERIYIGKNNKQNDYIISKLANDEDLWFHTKDCPGSHVLLKTQNITNELILKCAKLAKQYSTGSNSSKIGIIYTKRKYLRKPPKANLGYVTYKNEKEIIID